MVAILEEIKLVIYDERFIDIKNPFYGEYRDYISKNTFTFSKGRIYGIVSEYGGGGDAISLLLSDEKILKNEKIFINNIEQKYDIGWYLCKQIFSNGLMKKEQSMRHALEIAIKKYGLFNNVNEAIDKFHLSPDKLDYKFSNNCDWEKWRISLAIGYASEKKVFCFPWMNTLHFYDCMYNSSVFRFFKMLKKEGAIIILPTSRKENLYELADEIIYIHSPRFKHFIAESDYFQKYF